MDYVPASSYDIQEMLTTIGVKTFDELIGVIPPEIRRKKFDMPDGMSEFDAGRVLKHLSYKNTRADHFDCFLGAGAYDHVIPSVVPQLASRSEFYTAYTPYQPEASQGTLQAIFEYQSMICEITGLDASNASLYDGGSACAEAALMLLHSYRGRNEILVAGSLHPLYRDVVNTYLKNLDVKITVISHAQGVIDPVVLDGLISDKTAGLIVQSPNFFGCLEDVAILTEKVHEKGGGVAMVCNPLALGVLKTPGEYGVDIAVGDGQPLGLELSFGGPYFGFIACTTELMRRMPGRIVGMTKDSNGQRCYVLTLQAREQHIRREKATSNICSNQALMALRGCIYLTWLGKEGFAEIARQNIMRAHYAAQEVCKIDGVELLFSQPFFNEFCIKVSPASCDEIIKKLLENQILGGIPLKQFDSSSHDALLVSVTEKRTKDDIDKWVSCLKQALKK